MNLTIITPEKIVYEGAVERVMVPGEKGAFEILPKHAPILSTLVAGIIRYDAGERCSVEINSGFVEVAGDNIVICVEMKRQD